MSRRLRFALAPSLVAALLSLTARARAIEIDDVAGEPMSIDTTNTAVFNYHFDNENDKIADVGTWVDDDYAEWIDRLNVQVGWWRLRFGLRLDSAFFLGTTRRFDGDALVKEKRPELFDPGDINVERNKIYLDLNTRFKNTLYPSKLSIGYTQPGIDVTVGDFYAQLGRGLVFSVRKVDEVAVDTTVRGGKIVLDHDFGPVQVGATLFAGQMNPVRIDETTGRRLHGDGSPLFFGFPGGRDLVTYGHVGFGTPTKFTDSAQPSYLEDTVLGAHLEAGPAFVQVGLNGSLVLQKSYASEYLQCDKRDEEACESRFPYFGKVQKARPSQRFETVRTFSASVNIPSIAKRGDVYVEVAGQQLRDSQPTLLDDNGNEVREADLSGYAVYGSATGRFGPLSVSLEGKHYRSFLALSANVDAGSAGFSAPEFQNVAYSQPPTAEPIYVEPIGSPNTCVTGGWGRADWRFTKKASVYAWLGRYVSSSELSTENLECDTKAENKTGTWDTAVGSELSFEQGKTHTRAWVGARVTTREVPSDANVLGELTDEFYREGYLRYDVVKHITGPFSLQAQGFHRRRFEPSTAAEPWMEGENYTALQWSPHFSAIVGYEYTSRLGCSTASDGGMCHYINGGLQWKSASSEKALEQIFDTVTLFVGRRRGAIRCVSGVCRQFPPFEGAKIELVSRF